MISVINTVTLAGVLIVIISGFILLNKLFMDFLGHSKRYGYLLDFFDIFFYKELIIMLITGFILLLISFILKYISNY